tara:strand:- start:209 stop:637 length:429 start_codon:yes stop_codon:yes gene_type:complete
MNKDQVKIAVVISNFNVDISSKLLECFTNRAKEVEFEIKNIQVFNVPGAFEIPSIVKKLAVTKKYDAIVTLGSVIRGETIHFELIVQQVTQGIREISVDNDIPVIFGVLTVENKKQAYDRLHKGSEFFDSTLKMIDLFSKIS